MKATLFLALIALFPLNAVSNPELHVGAFNWDGGDTKAFSFFKIIPNGILYDIQADFVIETEGKNIYECLVLFDEASERRDKIKGYNRFREESCNPYLIRINRVDNTIIFNFRFDQLTNPTEVLIYRDADEVDKVTLRVNNKVGPIGKAVDTGMIYMRKESHEK
jgi:hypothetical protein